jgi:hypothetical protein
MWAIKRQETITEQPSEEDIESESQSYQNQQITKKNKIERILDSHQEQKNDYNYLIKKGKVRGYSENLTKSRVIPSLIREGREIIKDIKDSFSRNKNRNKSINSTDNRSEVYKIEEFSEKNKQNISSSVSDFMHKRSNSMNFVKIENYQDISSEFQFPEFDIKNNDEKNDNYFPEFKNTGESNLLQFNSVKSLTNSEKIR